MFSELSGVSRYRQYDPDDNGGQGDPDGQPETQPPPPPPPSADLKSVADSIRQAILESRAAAPAVAPMPTFDTSASTRRALEDESAQVNVKFNELVNSGQAAEAMAMRDAFIAKANRALAPAQDESAIVKTAVALGERAARTEHKDVMARWGDEVRRAVEAMPLDERVNPDAWDKAVSRVKSNHFDEILNEHVTMKVEAARKTFAPPPSAPGSRGARVLTGSAARLSEEQLWGADLCGVSADDYAKQLAREEAFDALPFRERAKFTGYPVLDDPRGNSVVEKGKF